MSKVLSYMQNIDELILKLQNKALTMAFAESCTGGLLSSQVTQKAGVSNVFMGGCVTYSNQSKIKLLGVPETLIQNHGAVDEEVALYMAKGAREAFGSDLALAITGIAGPGGGTPGKPVGTVCFAAVGLGAIEIKKTKHFQGSRAQVQEQSAAFAVALLLDLVNM